MIFRIRRGRRGDEKPEKWKEETQNESFHRRVDVRSFLSSPSAALSSLPRRLLKVRWLLSAATSHFFRIIWYQKARIKLNFFQPSESKEKLTTSWKRRKGKFDTSSDGFGPVHHPHRRSECGRAELACSRTLIRRCDEKLIRPVTRHWPLFMRKLNCECHYR